MFEYRMIMDLVETLTTPHRVATWRLDDKSLLALVPQLSTRMRQLDALRVRLVHEIDERCLGQKIGASSTQSWLSEAAKLTPAAAKRIVTAGQNLRARPDVTASFDTGVLDIDQVRSITTLLDQIPDLLSDLDPTSVDGDPTDPVTTCTQQCTDYLISAAEHEHAVDTANRAAALKAMLGNQDGPPPDDENEALNEFFASPTTGGRVRVKGHFDKVAGEQLLTALSALSKPQPGRDNTHGEPDPDPRTAAQRRADAITGIIRHYLDSGTAPTEGGETPHLTVFVGLDDLTKATRNSGDTNTHDSEGHPGPHAHDDSCGCDDRRADSGRSVIRRGPAWMPWLGPISIRLAAMLSCDATITPIVMDHDGNPLDVGRTTRTIPRRLRRALDARDCGCAFPGCGRPAAWTDGHHIHHWSNGGETQLSNLVLLCRFHHRRIHKGDWEVYIGDDGHPWFLPPHWIDTDRKPVPSHNRRQLAFTS
ncbi:HNH endonuclease signature motif containing protein [Rhodococcus olei]|uniref:HNH endonuclease signature motif containing protein n=1 Tax=Rhodococcus olei TaxID=2161675 RepID=A0ABP8PHU5_9NOCA